MKNAKQIALGGILGALAVTILFLGGLIPVSTYICPMLCMLILQLVLKLCGKRMAWAWYAMVSFLALILGPDKEAAAVLVLFGYYPIIKPKMDKLPLKILWKLVFFNAVTVFMYTVVVAVLGLEAIVVENNLIGYISLGLMLLLGNATFFLIDKLLTHYSQQKPRKRRK
ncbi:MAG: hypothetical protein E7453_02355 [Ruminococcaceae bacterium]|nr:hypothetical protein [Oscillospiraceae bacterium]